MLDFTKEWENTCSTVHTPSVAQFILTLLTLNYYGALYDKQTNEQMNHMI